MRTTSFEVPADGQAHGHRLTGSILHASCRKPHVVTVWAETDVLAPTMYFFRAYRDGELIAGQKGAIWHVSTVFDGDITVWHLYTGMLHELERGTTGRRSEA